MGNLCVLILSLSPSFFCVWGLTRLYSEWGIWVLVSRVDWPHRGLTLTSVTDEVLSVFFEPVKLLIKVALTF
jgi:hypothetical protein